MIEDATLAIAGLMRVLYLGRIGIWRCFFVFVFFWGGIEMLGEKPSKQGENHLQTQVTCDTRPSSRHIGGALTTAHSVLVRSQAPNYNPCYGKASVLLKNIMTLTDALNLLLLPLISYFSFSSILLALNIITLGL